MLDHNVIKVCMGAVRVMAAVVGAVRVMTADCWCGSCMKFLRSLIEAAVIANGEGHRRGNLLLLQALETG